MEPSVKPFSVSLIRREPRSSEARWRKADWNGEAENGREATLRRPAVPCPAEGVRFRYDPNAVEGDRFDRPAYRLALRAKNSFPTTTRYPPATEKGECDFFIPPFLIYPLTAFPAAASPIPASGFPAGWLPARSAHGQNSFPGLLLFEKSSCQRNCRCARRSSWRWMSAWSRIRSWGSCLLRIRYIFMVNSSRVGVMVPRGWASHSRSFRWPAGARW